jgi:pyrroloquinoline quinone biosynthesis protein B
MKKIWFIILLCTSINSFADENPPYLFILGVAQDAGYPQTACYQTHCMPGWENPLLRRGAVSLGLVSPKIKKSIFLKHPPTFHNNFTSWKNKHQRNNTNWTVFFSPMPILVIIPA